MMQQEILDAALALPEAERWQLVEGILATLGPDADSLDEAGFAGELQRRSEEIDADPTSLLPWSDLKAEPFLG